MPARRPLVIISGFVQQLPAGDTLDAAASEVDVISLSNPGGVGIPICSPVYITAANQCALARANAQATSEVIGIVRDSTISPNQTGSVQSDGLLTASTAQWDAVTGGTGGLSPGTVYFLSSATSGRITSTAPSSTGEYVVRLGRAVSTTALDLSIEAPILL